MLVVICDAIKFAIVTPIGLKSDVVQVMKKVITGIRQDYPVSLDEKVVWYIRRDNEPVLGSSSMTNLLAELRVSDAPVSLTTRSTTELANVTRDRSSGA